MSPEHISRPFGSYDPEEPLVISYGDLIAVRNVVGNFVTVLRDQVEPPSDFRKESLRLGIRIGVTKDREPYAFETFEETLQWLVDLRDRLTKLLPDLPSGPREV